MPRAHTHLRPLLPLFVLCLLASLPCASAKDPEAKWIRVSSSHFEVLTDAGEGKGREVVLRFEQMRAVFAELMMRTRVNVSQPVEIIAFKSDQDYPKYTPVHAGGSFGAPGFFLAGVDRNYVVLDLFENDSWRAVSHDFSQMLLNFNYPPTPRWFDEGFAEYFSSLRLTDKEVELGGDPGKLTGVLNGSPWMSISDLFSAKQDNALFHAQSWIVMHYLLNQNKLSETGTYFGLVQNQKIPVEQAIQQAYGMSAAQFDQAVKDYFHAVAAGTASQAGLGHRSTSPANAEAIGSSTHQVTQADAEALVAEMAVRLPEHREQGVKELNAIVSDPKMENAIAHRGLAWTHLENKEFTASIEELGRAMELDPSDVWVRYYLSLSKYRAAQASGQVFHGLSNMIQDLLKVLDWNPDFAEAYNMLAMARVEGGGTNSAMEVMRTAIQLGPRNEDYQLNLGLIYMAGKKWDAATALLERLKSSQNPQIAKAAKKNLDDLPFLKKYGLLPQQASTPPTGTSPPQTIAPQHSNLPPAVVTKPAVTSDDDEEERAQPPEPTPDKRPVLFLKGKLVHVDCGAAPAAVLTVTAGTKTLKLRTEDYKALLLIGASEFSCEWTNRSVAVNYKVGGKADGDLVSVEVQ